MSTDYETESFEDSFVDSYNVDMSDFEDLENDLSQQLTDDFTSISNTDEFNENMDDDFISEDFTANVESIVDKYENLADQAEDMVEEFEEYVLSNLSDENSIEQNYAIINGFEPSYDDFGFLKKLAKKAKSVVKKVVKVANKINPVAIALRKLNSIVRPFFHKIIGKVVNKLPEPFKSLIKKSLNIIESVTDQATGVKSPSVINPFKRTSRQRTSSRRSSGRPRTFSGRRSFGRRPFGRRSFGRQRTSRGRRPFGRRSFGRRSFGRRSFGQPTFYPGRFTSDYSDEYGSENYNFDDDYLSNDVQELTHQYIEDMSDATPSEQLAITEDFVATFLKVLKIAIKIVGRPKVVSFLAGLVSKFVSKLLKRDFPVSVSKVIVDKGMSALDLYVPAEYTSPHELLTANLLVDIGEFVEDYDSDDLSPELIQEGFDEAMVNILTTD